MMLHPVLRAAIDKRLQTENWPVLTARAAQLSKRYRQYNRCDRCDRCDRCERYDRDGRCDRDEISRTACIADDTDASAYMLARMPATYGAVYAALQQTIMAWMFQHESASSVETTPAPVYATPAVAYEMPTSARATAIDASAPIIRTMWDVGAGTGAASWAASALLALDSITCIEAVPAMVKLGQALMAEGPPVLQAAQWVTADITRHVATSGLVCGGPPPDLVIASYMLNELPEAVRTKTLRRLWESTGHTLLLVEPGTPYGFNLLRAARETLLDAGAFTTAPCPHDRPCPLPETDWCHFAARIPRSRAHKQAKQGDAPYEDEKFAYLAMSKIPCAHVPARIRRHPTRRKGHTVLSLCAEQGLRDETVTRRDGENYAQARKSAWGDLYLSEKR